MFVILTGNVCKPKMTKLNARMNAIASGEKFYPMTKECKRGHKGNRYAANGMCVACTDMNGRKREADKRAARILANTNNFEPAQVFKVVARPWMHTYLTDAAEVLKHGSDAQRMMLIEAITLVRQGVNIGMPVRSQGELNYDALRAAVDLAPSRICYVDGTPLDEQHHDDMGLLIRIGHHWYMATTLKSVWDQVRDVARPVALGAA